MNATEKTGGSHETQGPTLGDKTSEKSAALTVVPIDSGHKQRGDSQQERQQEQPPQAEPEDWRCKLVRAKNGSIKVNLFNCVIALSHAPDWQGLIRYNKFTHRIEHHGDDEIEQWCDGHDRIACAWLNNVG